MPWGSVEALAPAGRGEGREAFDLPDVLRRRRVGSVIEIPGQLQVQPELGFHAEELFKPERRVRGDPSLPMDQLVDAGIRYPDLFGERRLRHAERLEEFLQEHLPWMGWRTMRRDANHAASLSVRAKGDRRGTPSALVQ